MRKYWLILVSLLFIIWSCEKSPVDNPGDENEDEFVTLPISVKGEILSVTEMPMTRAGEVQQVFYIEVFASPTSDGQYTCYAFGIFSDLTKASLKLNKSYTYFLRARCFRPVHDIIRVRPFYNQYDFETILTNLCSYNEVTLNEFDYSGKKSFKVSNDNHEDPCVGVERKENTSTTALGYANDMDSFYSIISYFSPKNNNTISFDMMRNTYGYRFEVDNLSSGYVVIELTKSSVQKIDHIILTPDNPVFESVARIRTYSDTGLKGVSKDYSYKVYKEYKELGKDYTESPIILITYVDNENNSTVVYSDDSILFTRNKKKLFTIHLNNESGGETENPLSMTFDKDMTVEGDPIIISQQ